MRILHLCLSAFYIDNYGYQENILPKMHKLQGHEVKIIASTETYLENKKLGYIQPSQYINIDGIEVIRLPYVNWMPAFLAKKIRAYSGLEAELIKFKPDLIFLHDIQFASVREVVKYIKNNKEVRLIADGHTDYVNSARSWISKNILHKIIYKKFASLIEPYTETFYGTLPIRMDFFEKVYKLPSEKIKLLQLGADDTVYSIENKATIRKNTRIQFNLQDDDFVIITGGKIDLLKNIHRLVEAFRSISDKKLKLIIFGSLQTETLFLKDFFDQDERIIFLGWQDTSTIYNLLMSSDLGVFPGTHSVLWEQACGVGLPCVFKKWEGIQHVDLGGNCLFLKDDSVEEIQHVISKIYNDSELYNTMYNVSNEKCIEYFSYSKIAERALNL